MSFDTIDKAELERMIREEKGKFELIDVRSAGEIAGTGLISPETRNIPLGEITAAMDLSDAEFSRRYHFPKPKKDTPIVLTCRSGARSASAAGALSRSGFTKVINFRGGWNEWTGGCVIA